MPHFDGCIVPDRIVSQALAYVFEHRAATGTAHDEHGSTSYSDSRSRGRNCLSVCLRVQIECRGLKFVGLDSERIVLCPQVSG